MKRGVNWTFNQIEIVNINGSINILSAAYQLTSNFQKARIKTISVIVIILTLPNYKSALYICFISIDSLLQSSAIVGEDFPAYITRIISRNEPRVIEVYRGALVCLKGIDIA